MVVQVRVDDRLIHGQVAIVWPQELNTRGIVVANDKAASNKTLASTLRMGCPSSQRLLIKGVDDAARVIGDPRGRDMRMLVLVNCVADALRLVRACPDQVRVVNMANVGRFDGSDPATQVSLTKSVLLNPQELQAARDLVASGVEVFCQAMPVDRKVPIADELAKLQA